MERLRRLVIKDLRLVKHAVGDPGVEARALDRNRRAVVTRVWVARSNGGSAAG